MEEHHKSRPQEPTPDDDGSFEIWLVWSDKRIRVAPRQSALDALLSANVPIEPGCQVGSCGECITRYVEGDLIHKDSCLTAHDRKQHFCPCVSRAKGVLALPF